MKSYLLRRWEWGAVTAVLLIAAILRMGWPGYTEFKYDEARMVTLALEMIERRQLALRGMGSSVGLPNFPASVWLYGLPLLFWRHLYAATLFTGLVNTAATAGSYFLTRHYWGRGAALTAALTLAVSPWAVIFSRKIWAQNLLPLLALLWAATAVLALVERRPRFIALHILLLAIAAQTHLSAIALIPATGALGLIFWRRLDWRYVGLGAGLSLASVAPFLLHLYRYGLGADQTVSAMSGQWGLDSFRYTLQLGLGRGIEGLAGSAAPDYLALTPNGAAVHLLWGGLILVGVGYLAAQIWRGWGEKRAEAGLILLLWLFAPPQLFVWLPTPVHLHYFILTLPAQYMAAGVGALATARWLRRKLPATAVAWGGGAALVGAAGVQLWLIAALLLFVSGRATPGGFGVPVTYQLAAVAEAQALMAATGIKELLIVGPEEQPLYHEFPAVFDVMTRHSPRRFVDARHGVVFPAEAAVVLMDNRNGNRLGGLYTAVGEQQQTIPLRPGEGALTVMVLPAGAAPAPAVSFAEPIPFANEMRLLGRSELTRLNETTARWTLHWQTADQFDWRHYHFITELIDSGGRPLGQATAYAFLPVQWRRGDVVVTQFLFPWPDAPPPYTARVGVYHYPPMTAVPPLNGAVELDGIDSAD